MERTEPPDVEASAPRPSRRPAIVRASLRSLRSRPAFAALVGVASGIAMAVRLFVPVPIGLANNGDGHIRMCTLGLPPQIPPGSPALREFVYFRHNLAPPGGCPPGGYFSSNDWLMRIGHQLSNVMGYPGILDLRAMAVLFCVAVAFTFGVFAAALRGHVLVRLLICVGLFLVVGDVTFAGYAASPYSEYAGIIGIMVATVAATHLRGTTRARILALAVFVVAAAVTVASKTQSVTLVLPFAALLLFSPVPVGRLRGRFGSRTLPALGVLVVLASGALTIAQHDRSSSIVNKSQEVFINLIGKSDHPRQAAKDLGIPPDFARYAGTNWWSWSQGKQTFYQDPQWPEVEKKMTWSNIASFLIQHPEVNARILLDDVQDFGQARPDYLGSFSPEAGRQSGAQEHRLPVFTMMLQNFPGRYFVLVEVPVLLVLGLWMYRRSRGNERRRAFAATVLFLVGVVIVQFFTATYGDGWENTKHMVFAILASGLALVMTAAMFWSAPRTVEPEMIEEEHGSARLSASGRSAPDLPAGGER